MNAYQNLKALLSKHYVLMALFVVDSLYDGFSLSKILAFVIIAHFQASHVGYEDSDYNFLHAYGWYFALLFVVALFAPKDILSSYPILKNYFVDPVSSRVTFWLPIHKFSAISDFPEVTLLVFSLLIMFFPVATAIYVYKLSKKDQAFHYGLIFQGETRGNKFVVNLVWIYLTTLSLFLSVPGRMISPRGLLDRDTFLDNEGSCVYVN